MILLVSICLMASMVALAFYYWKEVERETEAYPREWWLRWMLRGLLVPLIIWAVVNVGRLPAMPPLTRNIGYTRGHGKYLEAFAAQFSLAGLVIVACWGVLSLGWFAFGLFKKARNKGDLFVPLFLWSPVLPLMTWACFAFFGWCGTTFGAFVWLWAVTHYFLEAGELKPPPPTYSRAIGKIKMGKYAEAEKAIIGQLEKCESDFDGWMMLADLYAKQFHDLGEAEKTICALCDEPTTTPSQMCVALHRLADWQLNLRGDPAAAQRVLEEICRRLPGTHLATMARHRINQLPRTRKELEQMHEPKTVIMPAWVEDLDAPQSNTKLTTDDALALANKLVKQLEENPMDIPAREKLARVFARQLGKFDLATEQIELLLELERQPAAKQAEWLGWMASWLTEQRGEGDAVEKILERLVHEFPQTQQAFVAQRKLSMMHVKPHRLKRLPGEEE